MAAFVFAICAGSAAAVERAPLYARILQDLNATLTDGSVWQIDKGDCFPVVAYKESHTKLILRLAGTQFVVAGSDAVIVSAKETPAAAESYRTTVNSYINGAAMRWRARAESAAQQRK